MRVFRQKYKDRTGKTRESAKWYVEVKDHLDVVRRMPGFTDKALTAELGRRIQKLVAVRVLGDILPPDLAAWVERLPQDIRDRLAQTGMVDPQTVASSKTLAAHLDDFEANLRHRGRTEEHVKLVTTRCRRIVDECGFRFIGDISASRVQRFLAGIKDGGAAQQTVNHYVRAIKQFGGWLVKDRRATENRLHDIETGSVKAAGVKCERRELNDDEILRLLDAARAGQSRFGLSGRQRHALYATALTTGLRASELASMTPAHFDFDSETPTVSIQASDEKARRGATLPIPASLVAVLQDFIATECEHDSTPLWPGKWAENKRGSKFIRFDLDHAREFWLNESSSDDERQQRERSDFLRYNDSDGKQADFHSLRHSYLSRLGRSGASAKVMQKLARHSTVELTLGRYTHANLHDLAAAVDGMPRLPLKQSSQTEIVPQALRATGTDGPFVDEGRSVLPFCLPERPALLDSSMHSDALQASENDAQQSPEPKCKNPLNRSVMATTQGVSEGGERGIRTPERRKASPVFKTGSPTMQGVENKRFAADDMSVLPAGLPVSLLDDADLARVVVAWPTLSEALKGAVLAIVGAAENRLDGRKTDDRNSK